MKKTKKRKWYPTKLEIVVLKVKKSEKKKMKALARKETRGNVSLLIRRRVLQSNVKGLKFSA